jgi:hypothetical protein
MEQQNAVARGVVLQAAGGGDRLHHGDERPRGIAPRTLDAAHDVHDVPGHLLDAHDHARQLQVRREDGDDVALQLHRREPGGNDVARGEHRDAAVGPYPRVTDVEHSVVGAVTEVEHQLVAGHDPVLGNTAPVHAGGVVRGQGRVRAGHDRQTETENHEQEAPAQHHSISSG